MLERGTIVEVGIKLSLSIIMPDNRRLHGLAAARERLLGGLQRQNQAGGAAGLLLRLEPVAKGMAMNYSDLPVEYRFRRNSATLS